MAKYILTEKQELDIIELCKFNKQSDVALKYSISEDKVYRTLKKYNVRYKTSRLDRSRLKVDTHYFEFIDSPEKAYWLGFIVADGHVNKKTGYLAIALGESEPIEKFKKEISSEHTITTRYRFDKRTEKTYIAYYFTVSNSIFCSYLAQWGVTNEKSNKFEFPNIEEKYYPSFIAGMFDGDGCIYKPDINNSLHINLISTYECLKFIQIYLSESFGIVPLNLKRVSNKNVWRMTLSKDSREFLKFIYSDKNNSIYMERKYNKYISNKIKLS